MRILALFATLLALAALTGCPPAPADKPLPPPGLAGSPGAPAAPGAPGGAGAPAAAGAPGALALPGAGVPVPTPSGTDPGVTLPAGHPPIDDATAGKPGTASAPPLDASNLQITGKVLEVLEVPQYTYMRLNTPGGEVWAAVGKAPVKVGDDVTIAQPMMMENFPSRALNRTFPKLIMGSLLGGAKPSNPPAKPDHPDHPKPPDPPKTPG